MLGEETEGVMTNDETRRLNALDRAISAEATGGHPLAGGGQDDKATRILRTARIFEDYLRGAEPADA